MGNGRRVVVEGDSLQKLKQERFELIGGHLEQMGNITSIINQQVDLAISAELGLSGVPVGKEEQEELVARCEAFGNLAARARLVRYNQGVLEICEMLNVRDLPDFVTWAALKASGVKLPVTETDSTPAEPKIITAH